MLFYIESAAAEPIRVGGGANRLSYSKAMDISFAMG
jgi:hypothetical protein